MDDRRVLVVGTTPDYIEHLTRALPGRLLFLTDPADLAGGGRAGKVPDAPGEEDPDVLHVVFPLGRPARAIERLDGFLAESGVGIEGVACFDCGSLVLAALIAERKGLPFASPEAVRNCRDKYRSKSLWRDAGVPCPRAVSAVSAGEALSFFRSTGGEVMLKPATLSGSELAFRCSSGEQVTHAYDVISSALQGMAGDPLRDRDGLVRAGVLCEEFIEGDEYSCDFLLSGGELRLIRIARKSIANGGPAGTAMAYEVPARTLPIPIEEFTGLLGRAARSLGLDRCMGMADLIVRGSAPLFLEMTPRPGGDCLPDLILASSGMDMLATHIDFAGGSPVRIPDAKEWRHLAALRVHSRSSGILHRLGLDRTGLGLEIVEEKWIRRPGDRIELPPGDHDSWLLGHLIFAPSGEGRTAADLRLLRDAVGVEVEEERHG